MDRADAGPAHDASNRLAPALVYALSVAALAAVYVVAAKLGLQLAVAHASATPVWPPTGIAIAVLLLAGMRLWPGVLLGAFIANATTYIPGFGLTPPAAAAGISVGNTLEVVTAAWFTIRFCGGRAFLDRPADVFRYAVLAGGLSTAVAATCGVTSLCLTGAAPWPGFGDIWLVWWLGDAVSAVMVAPVILVIALKPWPPMSAPRWLEVLAVLALTAAVAAFTFGGLTDGSRLHHPLSFAVIPSVVWSSFRFGLHGAALLGLMLSALAITGTLAGYGPFALANRTDSLLLLQAFMGTVTLSGLVLASTEGQRRRTSRDLEASEAEYRAIFELAGSGKALVEQATGRFVRVNRKLCEISGYAPDEMLQRTFSDLTHPDDREWSEAAARRMMRGEDPEYHVEKRWVRKDGEVIWVSVTATLVPGRPGRPPMAAGVVQDITAAKRAQQELARHRDHLETLVRERTAELESSRERARFAERMAALGALSAGLGHDMGNLLLPIRVRLEALERTDLAAADREHLTAIRTASTYLQRLANGLRLLAVDPLRRGPEPVSEIHEWWADAAPILKAALPPGIRFESNLVPGPCWVRMSKAGLTQAVFNLMQNAGDAMRSRAHGTVRTTVEVRDGAAHVSVADDGPGMAPEVRARCIEPFFTTKTRGISTGLGLSLVFALVRETGGDVRLESEPGRGTTFTLILSSGRPANPPRTGADRLAVVNVQRPHLRAFIQRELREMGFRVANDASGNAPPDLLVLDSAGHADSVKPGGRIVALDRLNGTGGPPAEPAISLIRRCLAEVAGTAGDEERGDAPGAEA